MDANERLAFIEQVAGAPPTHRVLADRTEALLYEGPEASARLVYAAYWTQFVQGDESVGPVRMERMEHESS